MDTNTIIHSVSPFRIKRPLITTSGFDSDVDSTIKSHLDELNKLLGKRVFHTEPNKSKETRDVVDILKKNLTPKYIPNKILYSEDKQEFPVAWNEESLAYFLNGETESDQNITLSEYIDMTTGLSAMRYEFQGCISANWFNLNYNAKTILNNYPAITDYLITYAFLINKVKDVNGLTNFIQSSRDGVRNVVNYAVVGAARTIIDDEQLKVPKYNDDNTPIVNNIKSANLSLSSASFKTAVKSIIDDYVYNSKWVQLIDYYEQTCGVVPPDIKPLLIQFIKNSPVPINNLNAPYFISFYISQIVGMPQIAAPTDIDVETSDKDFDVQYFEDDKSMIQISKSAVKCAAQLYYAMILGDVLDVFNVMNYFTHKYLIRGGIGIQDRFLRDDLQMYVFSGKFTELDPKTHKPTNIIHERTRVPERQMFYKQVFNYGSAQVTDDLIVNLEFPKLWKVLILESAKYIERAQLSPNPDSYVSRQNVMQAVEDLQYNLSTHCTGMANVITPLIYKELDFLIYRIFMHHEILQQVVPSGGTWWKVVETLYIGMKNMKPKATVLYNKAKLGDTIIRSIANYNPATFEDDKNFFEFISNVDAFITTQSILQEALVDDLKKDEEEGTVWSKGLPIPTYDKNPDASAVSGEKTGQDEWDF